MAESGKKLKQLRNYLGLTQDDLSVIAGVHRITVGNWEDTQPKYEEDHVAKMIAVGINPFFVYGHGDVIMQGETVATAQQKIADALKTGRTVAA